MLDSLPCVEALAPGDPAGVADDAEDVAAAASPGPETEVLAAGAGGPPEAGCGLALLVLALAAVGGVGAGALELEPMPAVAVLVPPGPAVAARLVEPVVGPRTTSLLAWAVGPPLGHDWPVGCWLRRLLISVSMREPAPIGPGG